MVQLLSIACIFSSLLFSCPVPGVGQLPVNVFPFSVHMQTSIPFFAENLPSTGDRTFPDPIHH